MLWRSQGRYGLRTEWNSPTEAHRHTSSEQSGVWLEWAQRGWKGGDRDSSVANSLEELFQKTHSQRRKTLCCMPETFMCFLGLWKTMKLFHLQMTPCQGSQTDSSGAIMSYYRLSDLSSEHLFLMVQTVKSPRSGCQHCQVLGKGPLPDCVLIWPFLNVCMQKERGLVSSFFVKGLIPP